MDGVRLQLHDKIGVLGQTRYAIDVTGVGADHHVGDAERFQGVNDGQRGFVAGHHDLSRRRRIANLWAKMARTRCSSASGNSSRMPAVISWQACSKSSPPARNLSSRDMARA